MKGMRILVVLSLVLVQVAAFAVIKRTLIDFNKYDEHVKAQYPAPAVSYVTNIDGSPQAVVGYSDYMLDKWTVDLNETARSLHNRVLSYCKPVTSKRFGTVLGSRVHFPTWRNNAYALIKTPFPVKVYDDKGEFANVENGVMPNVWEIKSLSIWVNGRNFNYQIAIRLRDRDSKIHEYALGNLFFDGWRKLVWQNPNYTDKIYAKTLNKTPLYPRDIPYIVFDSIVIYRQANETGGDFVTYLGKIDMEYIPYIVDQEDDISDEAVWNIIADRGRKYRAIENRKLTEKILLQRKEEFRIKQERVRNGMVTN